mmetsp:Transcript_8045/g.15811  ORF Transcript_8045/g.15811 Transcript_8045/m.15811 type:complete len:172 (+) Transcript_8045:516-1031(+)
MMNYPRRPMMMRPPQQPQERNFGTDLHAFMDGLSRIVQIAYSSLPVIAFVKVVCKYAWKFCLFLGSSVVGRSTASYHLTDASLDLMWQKPSMRGTMIKVAALALAFLLIYRSSGGSDDSEMDEVWHASEEPEEVQPQPPMIRSEEDRVFQYEEEAYEDEECYYDEDYPIAF